ncbi:uncharacterized protein TNCT_135951 [Trichonephila clavata]|uniref:MBD domain-containing protein n=1 Tax=Trichonephila clavata TaxID=2740835 RepID=A0A8X6LVQ2_TRICU|nr:uncharacterized protein TNCT_135951 [Trichonephila clavata]
MEVNNLIPVLTQNNWNTGKHDMQLLHEFFGTRYQPGEDVGIFISRVKTVATRLHVAGHKLDDLYIGFQLIRWLPQEFQSTVQQIYRWKEENFTAVKIEAELILESNRLQLMKQDLEKTETFYFSNFLPKKKLSKVPRNVNTVPGGTTATPADPSDKTEYQKKDEVKWIRNIGREVTGSNVYYGIAGTATRLRSFNEIERYCNKNNIQYDPSLFNFRKEDTESQEVNMVEVDIPNCYEQAIRSREAS